MSLSDHQWEFLKDVALLIIYANQHEYKLTGGRLFDTVENQKRLVDAGFSQTMNSYHLKKLAIDLNVFFKGKLLIRNTPENWNEIKFLGDYWESLNHLNRWGGDWNKDNQRNGFVDSFHFERSV